MSTNAREARAASSEIDAATDVTVDSLLSGAVTIVQPAHGYRVNIDAILLAAFAAGRRPVARLVDLGAGVGAVSLVTAHLVHTARVELVEQDPALAALARVNLARAGLDGAVHQLELGVDKLPATLAGVDLVVANPPYFAEAATRPARDPRARRARSGTLLPFVDAARLLLASARARAAFAYPARSLPALLEMVASAGLVAKRLRMVHADADSAARLALVELRRARPGGLVVEPPLFEWAAPGVRSAELSALIERRASGRT